MYSLSKGTKKQVTKAAKKAMVSTGFFFTKVIIFENIFLMLKAFMFSPTLFSYRVIFYNFKDICAINGFLEIFRLSLKLSVKYDIIVEL